MASVSGDSSLGKGAIKMAAEGALGGPPPPITAWGWPTCRLLAVSEEDAQAAVSLQRTACQGWVLAAQRPCVVCAQRQAHKPKGGPPTAATVAMTSSIDPSRFELIECIGRGSFGDVWRGWVPPSPSPSPSRSSPVGWSNCWLAASPAAMVADGGGYHAAADAATGWIGRRAGRWQ